jgi:hypothetical protein
MSNIYNTTNQITTLKKHVNANHSIITKIFEDEVNSPLKGDLRNTLLKKDQINLAVQLSIFFATKEPSQKYHMQQKMSFKDMGFFIIKNNMLM